MPSSYKDEDSRPWNFFPFIGIIRPGALVYCPPKIDIIE
jgi:hypothetical protein